MREKIKELEELKRIVTRAKASGQRVVFTNGCFDIIHRGHLQLLSEAKKLGDVLVVALNSDSSVRKIKGAGRPVLPETDRAELLAALEMVDYVVLFDEPDPLRLLEQLRPHVLVKGGDWPRERIVGKEVVQEGGGEVVVVPYLEGHSTTAIIERMRKAKWRESASSAAKEGR